MKNNLQTEAGQTNPSKKNDLIDALNQSFALFKLNYHNQFLKAFSNEKDLIAIKRVWLDSLKHFEAQEIMRAAHAIVKTSEFLPTLKTMLDACERSSAQTLPEPHSAYAEACNASSPKQAHAWSHPAVYHTGKKVGWHFLQSTQESMAFPVFKEAYLELTKRIREGEKLEAPKHEQITHQPYEPANAEVGDKYLNSLKSLFIDE